MKELKYLLFVSCFIQTVAGATVNTGSCAEIMSTNLKMTDPSLYSDDAFTVKDNALKPFDPKIQKKNTTSEDVYEYVDSSKLKRKLEVRRQKDEITMRESFDPIEFDKVLKANLGRKFTPTPDKVKATTYIYSAQDGECKIKQSGFELNLGRKNTTYVTYDAVYCERLSKGNDLSQIFPAVDECTKVLSEVNEVFLTRQKELSKENKTLGMKINNSGLENLFQVTARCLPQVWPQGVNQYIEDFNPPPKKPKSQPKDNKDPNTHQSAEI